MPRLTPLAADDLDALMRIERTPGYEAFIGQFSREEHAAELASPDAFYLGWKAGDDLVGFAILQTFREPHVTLRRIAVAETDHGLGTAFLREVMGWTFANTPARALRLFVRRTNERARRIYLREGFAVYETLEDGERMAVTREVWSTP